MENYIKNGNVNIWTEITGIQTGKNVILCSGGPGCCDYLFPVSQMIDDGYSVIRFDQRGCGRSDKDGKYDLETTMSDLEAIREFYGINSWVVGGHSWGANLALVYTVKYPNRVQALLYIAGSGIHDNRHWSETFHRNKDEIGESLPDMAYPFNPEVNTEGNRTLCEFGRAPNFYSRVSKLDVPTLFMIAEKDIRPSWPVEQIQALITNSIITIIAGAAHYIWLTHYNEMRFDLRKFLNLPI